MPASTLLITTGGIQLLGADGTLSTIALPTGVTQVAGKRTYVAVLNQNIVVTGSVSTPVWIQPSLGLAVLTVTRPGVAPTLSAGAAGGYTGTRRAKVSFIVKDPRTGALLGESPLSDPSAALKFTAQKQVVGALAVSPNTTVTGRRVYLTADNGTDYFHAFDIDDNTTTSVTVDLQDADLDLVSASTDLASAPPDLDLVIAWKDRIFGVTGTDTVAGSGSGQVTSWPLRFPIDPRGSDSIGVSGFLPRRDELGICRRNVIWKLTGSDETNFAIVKLIEGKGCIAPATCLVIRDVAYFLSDDGIYVWDAQGVRSITDDLVKPWFTTDTYFNRAGFKNAFAGYDPVRHRYLVFLPVVGGDATVLNRWIELDIDSGKWFGIHQTAAVTGFSAAVISPDASNRLRLILSGSDNFLYAFTPGTFTDGASTAIDFKVVGPFHQGDSPDLTHVWLQPTLLVKGQSGGVLSVTPTVGDLTSTAGTTQSYDLTKERARLARLGIGRLCSLTFEENTAGQAVEIYGYLIPYITQGRR